jgi:hypothetical protein
MAENRRVHLFAEDLAHERFLTAILERLASEIGCRIHVTTANARGGHGRALTELRTHQRALLVGGGTPDLLVVAIDANCSSWKKVRNDVLQIIDPATFPAHVLAVPDPHVERWYLADPPALVAVAEASVSSTRRKCDRDEYKQILVNALRAAGHPVSLGGAEFAAEIVAEMDFFRAGKNEPSLKHFIDELRGLMKSWR